MSPSRMDRSSSALMCSVNLHRCWMMVDQCWAVRVGTMLLGVMGVSRGMLGRDTTAPPYSHASVARMRCANGAVSLADSNGSFLSRQRQLHGNRQQFIIH